MSILTYEITDMRELRTDEIEEVSGGVAPIVALIVRGAVSCGRSNACRGAVIGAAGAAAAFVGYENNRV